MKSLRRFALALSLIGVLGAGLNALAIPTDGCVTLVNQTTCEAFLCCPTGSGPYSCTPTTPPYICP